MQNIRDSANQSTDVTIEKGSQHNLRLTIPVAPKGIDRKELDGYYTFAASLNITYTLLTRCIVIGKEALLDRPFEDLTCLTSPQG